jgi:hypothetical protein
MYNNSIEAAPRIPGALRLPADPDNLPRPARREVTAELGRGVVRGAAVQATAYVAELGLDAVARLTRDEEYHLEQSPRGAARYALIVDTATEVIATEVARMRGRGCR